MKLLVFTNEPTNESFVLEFWWNINHKLFFQIVYTICENKCLPEYEKSSEAYNIMSVSKLILLGIGSHVTESNLYTPTEKNCFRVQTIRFVNKISFRLHYVYISIPTETVLLIKREKHFETQYDWVYRIFNLEIVKPRLIIMW